MKKAISMLKQWWIGRPEPPIEERNRDAERYRRINQRQERTLRRLNVAARDTHHVVEQALERLRDIR